MPEQLQALNITVLTLDFDNGHTPVGCECFRLPFTKDRIRHQLRKIYQSERDPAGPDFDQSFPTGNDFVDSLALEKLIYRYLTEGANNEALTGELTPWKQYTYRFSHLNNFRFHGWENGATFLWPNEVNGHPDAEIPHSGTILKSKDILREEVLSQGEVATALWLSARCFQQLRTRHRFYPSLTISTSGRKARLVEAVLDTNTLSYEIRYSKIVDFTFGIHRNYDAFCTLLGHFIGMPCGNTKFSAESSPETGGENSQDFVVLPPVPQPVPQMAPSQQHPVALQGDPMALFGALATDPWAPNVVAPLDLHNPEWVQQHLSNSQSLSNASRGPGVMSQEAALPQQISQPAMYTPQGTGNMQQNAPSRQHEGAQVLQQVAPTQLVPQTTMYTPQGAGNVQQNAVSSQHEGDHALQQSTPTQQGAGRDHQGAGAWPGPVR